MIKVFIISYPGPQLHTAPLPGGEHNYWVEGLSTTGVVVVGGGEATWLATRSSPCAPFGIPLIAWREESNWYDDLTTYSDALPTVSVLTHFVAEFSAG